MSLKLLTCHCEAYRSGSTSALLMRTGRVIILHIDSFDLRSRTGALCDHALQFYESSFVLDGRVGGFKHFDNTQACQTIIHGCFVVLHAVHEILGFSFERFDLLLPWVPMHRLNGNLPGGHRHFHGS